MRNTLLDGRLFLLLLWRALPWWKLLPFREFGVSTGNAVRTFVVQAVFDFTAFYDRNENKNDIVNQIEEGEDIENTKEK